MTRPELVKYLDHLARCVRGGLHGDDAAAMRMTSRDEAAIQQAANELRATEPQEPPHG